MKPIVNGLVEEYGQSVAFLQLDAENDGREAFASFNLRGHPSYVIIDSLGGELWKSVGEQPASELRDAIHRALEED